MISLLLIHFFKNNLAFANTYTLAEFITLLWLFYSWNPDKKKWPYVLWLSFGCVVWVLDNFILHSISRMNGIFRICYSLIVAWEASLLLIRELGKRGTRLFANPLLMIAFSFLLYYSFKAFIQVFLVAGSLFSRQFRIYTFAILLIINLVTNLLYAIILLCVHRKQKSFLSSY